MKYTLVAVILFSLPRSADGAVLSGRALLSDTAVARVAATNPAFSSLLDMAYDPLLDGGTQSALREDRLFWPALLTSYRELKSEDEPYKWVKRTYDQKPPVEGKAALLCRLSLDGLQSDRIEWKITTRDATSPLGSVCFVLMTTVFLGTIYIPQSK